VDVGAPFDLVGGDDVGVLCVHGFTSTPFEVRFLGEQLARAGYTAVGPRLPGHGTTLDDLDVTTWQDWVAAIDGAFDDLRRRCARVVVVGQSLGGLLALHLTARRGRDVAAVASLAAPLWLDGAGRRVAALAARGVFDHLPARLRRVPKFSGSDVADASVRAANPCYDAIPLKALGELARFMPVVNALLPDVRRPLLVMHAIHDHTAPVACAYEIAARAHAARLRILPRSYHLIAADVERDIVATEIIDFVRRATLHDTDTGDHACAT
jgi:carboxylesterase